MFAFISVHFHFACDLLGSRGDTADDIWGIYYFAPFTTEHGISWAGQWPLVGWQNMAITAVLLGIVMVRAATTGYSPLGLLSGAADHTFIATLRKWRKQLQPARHGGDQP